MLCIHPVNWGEPHQLSGYNSTDCSIRVLPKSHCSVNAGPCTVLIALFGVREIFEDALKWYLETTLHTKPLLLSSKWLMEEHTPRPLTKRGNKI